MAGSTEPSKVLKAMKSNANPEFVFGEGKWWGSTLWGLDNAVVGRWPVVVVEGGKARIKEFRSVSGWLNQNGVGSRQSHERNGIEDRLALPSVIKMGDSSPPMPCAP